MFRSKFSSLPMMSVPPSHGVHYLARHISRIKYRGTVEAPQDQEREWRKLAAVSSRDPL